MTVPHVAAAVVGGVLFGVIVISIARKGILSMRYTFGWLFIAACIVLGGVLSGVFGRLASALDIAALPLVVALAAVGLLAITVQLSITVSGLTETVRTLAESVAMLEEKLERTNPDPETASELLSARAKSTDGET